MIITIIFFCGTLFLSLNSLRFLGLPISDWFYFGALFCAIFETFVTKKNIVAIWAPAKIFLWPALLVTLGAIISLSNSKNVSVALNELFQQLYVITLFISLIWFLVKRGKTELIITAFIVSGFFTAAIAAIDYFMGTNYGPILSGAPFLHFIGRYAGSLGHPNKLGYFLVITIFLTFYKLFISIGKKKSIGLMITLILALIVQGVGIYLSGSVTAYLGLLIGALCLVYGIASSQVRKFIIFFCFLFIIAFLLVNIVWINSIYHQNFSIANTSLIGIGINRVLNFTARTRLDLYKQSIDYIVQSPIIGIGFDQNASSGILQDARILSGSIHNLFLQMFYMGGLFAFLGWLILHFSIGKVAVTNLFQGIRKQFVLSNVLSATVIAIIAMDQFTNAIYQREKWLVVGLLVGITWINKNADNRLISIPANGITI